MIIMQNKVGQLANRLFAFSHFIGNAIEHKYVLINPTFAECCKYFRTTRDNDFGDYPISVKFGVSVPFPLFERLTHSAAKYISKSRWHEFVECSDAEECDLNSDDFIEKAKRKVVFANGWLFRDHRNLAKHSEIIRSFFAPDEEAVDSIKQLIFECRKECDVLIGVHIRRGDYKEWQSGKYFFSDETYADKMSQLANHFDASGKRVAFLICSNESIDVKNFGNCRTNLGVGQVIEDLYSLSECDYIIGPPSTFSMWASFYGKVPLLHIQNQAQPIAAADFLVV